MPIPAGVTKFVLYGTQSATEIFETGFWCVGQSPTSDADVQVMAGKVATHWAANSHYQKEFLTDRGAYTEVRAYYYDGTAPGATHTGAAPITGGEGLGDVQYNPLQSCAVMTLRTGYAGRSNRGRMYLPATGIQLLNSATFATADLQGLVTEVAAFLTACATDGGIGAPVVVSQRRGSYQTITAVDADYRPDVQRRRANKQATGGRFGVAVAS